MCGTVLTLVNEKIAWNAGRAGGPGGSATGYSAGLPDAGWAAGGWAGRRGELELADWFPSDGIRAGDLARGGRGSGMATADS